MSLAIDVHELIEWRRHFHRNPELAFEEHETAKFIANALRSFGYKEVFTEVGKTGVVALLKGALPVEAGQDSCIALRADMDALPIQEQDSALNGEYKSRTKDVMHACGHDAHCAVLLATAKALLPMAPSLRGTIKFLFQPAEEGKGGAKAVIADGFLEEGRFGPRVDRIFGLHVWNYLPCGQIGVRKGPIMAASDRFLINITGSGGHGAVPDGTADAIVAGSHLVTALHTVVSRNVSPIDSAVITVGTFNSGTAANVISDKAVLSGTVRSFLPTTQQLVINRMQAICDGVSTTYGVTATLQYNKGYPATTNSDDAALSAARAAAVAAVGEKNVLSPEATMCAEDFSFYLQRRPGCFFFVGSGRHSEPSNAADADCCAHQDTSAAAACTSDAAAKGSAVVPHHRSDFDIDERCLEYAANAMVALARGLMHSSAPPSAAAGTPSEE